jgi:hypothetical protein
VFAFSLFRAFAIKETVMTEQTVRMVNRDAQPDNAALADWMGEDGYKRWAELVEYIETNYPGVFEPDWLFGGKKHGWCLRYKKSKSFCTLIPEKGRLVVMIVFGAQERAKVEEILSDLVSHAREDYEAATTYHDGKWMTLTIDSDEVFDDVKRFLYIKRKPKG